MFPKIQKINIIHKKIEEEGRSELFDTYAFNAYINDELVGYAKLSYIPKQKAEKINSPMDYYIYKNYSDNESILNAYKEKNYEYLIQKLSPKLLDKKSSIEDIYHEYENEINNLFFSQYKRFYDYWVNKPSIDLIRVFSEKDTKVSDLINKKIIERKPKNYQKQGIGISLYIHIADWCKSNNLHLWSSQTQTEDAKKIWESMEKNPKFLVLMQDAFEQSINNSNQSKIRKHLTLNH